jgi:hypothetical protein
MRQNTKFRRLGRDAWIDTLFPRDPILPAIRGAFVLTDVTVVHADRPDEEHVDVLVSQANIKRITPTGMADLPPGATVFERARGSFVSSALTDIFLLQTLRHGITVVRDAGDPDGTATPAALASIASGALPGPEIHYASASRTPRQRARRTRSCYEDPAQAPGMIKRLQFLGATSVKSYENLDLPRIAFARRALS